MEDQFKKDLIIGEDEEYRILKEIQKKYPLAKKIKGNFKDYDLYVPEKKVKVEVKTQKEAIKYYFIECSCNDSASGLQTTKADYWVIVGTIADIWVNTTRLRVLCSQKGKLWKGIPTGGYSMVTGYLVPKDVIQKNAVCYKVRTAKHKELF